MNNKYYLHIWWLLIILLFSPFLLAQTIKVDLNQISATGLEHNRIKIDNILVTTIIPDPLIPDSSQEVVLPPYDLIFKACQFEDGLLHLIPLLEPEEPDCHIEGVDFHESKGFGRDHDRVQLNYLWFSKTLSDSSDSLEPHHPEISTEPEHLVFKFEPETLHLVQSFEPTLYPNQIKITLNWDDTSADLDAHLMGPIGPHSLEPFHVSFANKNSDVAQLEGDDIIEQRQQEVVTIFPPLLESSPADILRPGIYTFMVNYFRGFGDFLNSGVRINLQIGNEPQREFIPPPLPSLPEVESFFGNKLDTWIVFELHLADDGMASVLPIQNYDGIISPL